MYIYITRMAIHENEISLDDSINNNNNNNRKWNWYHFCWWLLWGEKCEWNWLCFVFFAFMVDKNDYGNVKEKMIM